MKVHFVFASTSFSGGKQEHLRHALALAHAGHDVALWLQSGETAFEWMRLDLPIHPLPDGEVSGLPPADVCFFDRCRLAAPLVHGNKGKVVHFCQGYEGLDVEMRLSRLRAEKGLLLGFPEWWKLRKRRQEIEQAYHLPTAKLVVHPHLADLIASRFSQPSWLVPNGLPRGLFSPPTHRRFDRQSVLVVGPMETNLKRIVDALEAVRLLKQIRPGIHLIRVSQTPMGEYEHRLGITDEYHTMLPPQALAELYRQADVLFSVSACEGFGLPALEAMASGLPCVLTELPSYRGFAQPADYAHFVPVGNPERQAEVLGRLLIDVQERQRLSQRGPSVAAAYTEERSRQAMHEALLHIVGGEFPLRRAG